MMVPYMANLWAQERYRYAPFALVGVAWLTYMRWDFVCRAPRGWISWLGLILGMGLVLLGALIPSPWVAGCGFIALATVFLTSSQGEHDPSLIGVALPLFLLVRLPLGYDQILVIKLQRATTIFSSVLLDVIRVPHAIANNTLQLPSRELFVAEACSGIQSVFTLMFLATILVAIYRRPLWFAPIYLAAGVVLAVFANVVRVSMVAVGDVWFKIDLAQGWQHEVVGYFALSIGILLLLSFDRLIVLLLHPIEQATVSGTRNLFIEFWNLMVTQTDDNNETHVGPIVRGVSN